MNLHEPALDAHLRRPWREEWARTLRLTGRLIAETAVAFWYAEPLTRTIAVPPLEAPKFPAYQRRRADRVIHQHDGAERGSPFAAYGATHTFCGIEMRAPNVHAGREDFYRFPLCADCWRISRHIFDEHFALALRRDPTCGACQPPRAA